MLGGESEHTEGFPSLSAIPARMEPSSLTALVAPYIHPSRTGGYVLRLANAKSNMSAVRRSGRCGSHPTGLLMIRSVAVPGSQIRARFSCFQGTDSLLDVKLL